MTGLFDNLSAMQRHLPSFGISGEATESEIEAMKWLVEHCVKDADSKLEGWNWSSWKQKESAQKDLKAYGELWTKLEYLGYCHEKLDHGGFHGKVFSLNTTTLIQILYQAIIEKKDDLEAARGRILNQNPNLAKILQSLGYKPDKNWGGMYRRAEG